MYKKCQTRVFGKSVNTCLVEKQHSSDKHLVSGSKVGVRHNCSLPVAHSMASEKFHNVRDGKSTKVEQSSAEVGSKLLNVRDGKSTGVEQGSDEVSLVETHAVIDANSTGVEQVNAEVSSGKICNMRDGKSGEVMQCQGEVISGDPYNVRESKSIEVEQTSFEVSGHSVQGCGLGKECIINYQWSWFDFPISPTSQKYNTCS